MPALWLEADFQNAKTSSRFGHVVRGHDRRLCGNLI